MREPLAPQSAPSPLRAASQRAHGLHILLDDRRREREALNAKAARLRASIALEPKISAALDQLSKELFGRIARLVEEKLTLALEEIFGEPLRLKVEQDFKRGTATLRFAMERNGEREEVLKGQGGSVANVLSVGLRMLALANLDPQRHRRFLVLDEQDAWLHPDLVPRLVKVVKEAARALGFQVIMISHHDLDVFDRHADRIFRFTPGPDGVKVEQWKPQPREEDSP